MTIDNKSKVLFLMLTVLIVVSVLALYKNTILDRNFVIIDDLEYSDQAED